MIYNDITIYHYISLENRKIFALTALYTHNNRLILSKALRVCEGAFWQHKWPLNIKVGYQFNLSKKSLKTNFLHHGKDKKI